MSDSGNAARTGGAVIFVGAVVLGILHQDFWWWDADVAIAGVMPIGLGYHVLYSFMAAGLWAVACKIAWPKVLEEDGAPGGPGAPGAPGGEASS